MREQPHYTNVLTKEFFEKHYIEERKSMIELVEMLKAQYPDLKISRSTLHKYCQRVGVPIRDKSEARRNWDPDPLDWTRSFETEELIEWIDGFLLGDGNISPSNSSEAARVQCTQEHEEFTTYQMTKFLAYKPFVNKVEHKKSKNNSPGFYWDGKTKIHPDLYKHYLRWYPTDNVSGKRVKQPPDDVRITPTSVMVWYLGDGSIVETSKNCLSLRLSTDSFDPRKVEFLSSKLRERSIACHRSNDNRIYVEAEGIPAFFDYIGRKSPVSCYSYKFDLPEWRFAAKRMGQVAEELGIDYQHLAYKVKIGEVKCERASEQGRPRFLPEHVEALRALVASCPGIWMKKNEPVLPRAEKHDGQ